MLRFRCRTDPLSRSFLLLQARKCPLRHPDRGYKSFKAAAAKTKTSPESSAGGNTKSPPSTRAVRTLKQKSNTSRNPKVVSKNDTTNPTTVTTNKAQTDSPDRTSSTKAKGLWTSLKEALQNPTSKLSDAEAKDHGGPLEPWQSFVSPVTEDHEIAAKTVRGKTGKTGKTDKADKAKSKNAIEASPEASPVPQDDSVIIPKDLELRPVGNDTPLEVPKLNHNLDRVLFNPGVYQMQDYRTQVYNFDPYVATIMPNDEFDFDALKGYITSSQDPKLRELSAAHGTKYCGSTSSMTSILSHFHFLISGWRPPNYSSLSRVFSPDSNNYTNLTRGPAAAFLKLEDGIYAIDADKEFDTESVLSLLGKSMEKLLTLPKEEFEKYRRSRSHQLSDEEKNADESFHYTILGDFMMRSQLDAYDSRLPGTGVFDLKTRAVVSIRMDVGGYEKGVGYEIRRRFGQWESFEREYYDMIRAAFLKYSLQVRMGRMDGIFVAFHNTKRIFGFQYIPLEEMDQAIHNSRKRLLGDKEFKGSLKMLNDLLNRATERFPGRSLRLHVETRPTKIPLTYFFVEPVTEAEIEETQKASKSSAERLGKSIIATQREQLAKDVQEEQHIQAESEEAQTGREPAEYDESADEGLFQEHWGEWAWVDMVAKVGEVLRDDSLGPTSVRGAVQGALEQRGLLQETTESGSTRCVDTLFETLTAAWADSSELRATPEDVILSHESEKQSRELADEQDEQEDDEAEAPKEQQSDLAEHEEQDADATSSSDGDTTQPASLQALIVICMEMVDRRADSPGTFERALADLVAKPSQPDPKVADDADDSLDSTSPLPPIDSVSEMVVEDLAEDGADDAETASDQTETAGEETKSSKANTAGTDKELLGFYVTVRNKVKNKFVKRPEDKVGAGWKIHYTVSELPNDKAQKIYKQIKSRRKTIHRHDPKSRASQWYKMFDGKLEHVTKRGAEFRARLDRKAEGSPVKVA